MDSLEPKKLALLRILQVLERYSDEEHLLTQEEIARLIAQEYGIELERKAVGRNLSLLREAGYEIASERGGCCLAVRPFTDAELRMLIDGVLSSKHIAARYSKDLIEKLCALSSKYFRAHVKYVYAVNEWDKTENKTLFYNIELIDEAIEQGKQVRFEYNRYGADGQLHKSRAHHASPYQLILHNQRYYLMARNEWWKDMTYYRLDLITNMTITEDRLTPLCEVEGFENGIDYKELSTALPYMYNDRPERVEFLIERSVIDQVIDWFGKDVKIEPAEEDRYKVAVKVSPLAMKHWAMQYAPHVRVLSPASLVEAIKEDLQKTAELYGK